MAGGENRRVRVTRKIFQDSLMELMAEHPLGKISVTDVCERADMNRSTFYAHYRDVSELLAEVESEVIRQLPLVADSEESYTSDSYLKRLENFLLYIQKNARLFHTLIVQSENSGFFHKLVDAVINATAGRSMEEATLKDQYTYMYCVNGVVGILKDWIGNDFPISAAEFAQIMVRLCYSSLIYLPNPGSGLPVTE